MIALVTMLFGFTWAPIHCFHFAMKIVKDFPFDNQKLFTIKTLTHTFTYMNSMLNPFLYTIMGNNFRKQVFAQKAKVSTRFKSYYLRNNTNALNGNLLNKFNKKQLNSTSNETCLLNNGTSLAEKYSEHKNDSSKKKRCSNHSVNQEYKFLNNRRQT